MSDWRERLEESGATPRDESEPEPIPCNTCGTASPGRVCPTCQRCKW